MGFLSFGQSKKTLDWIDLTDQDQLDTILNGRSEKPIIIFKHSTRCSISSMALSRFEAEWNSDVVDCDLYFLDLITFRNLSNQIAERTGVIHQSPQAIVLVGNEVVYQNSHSGISAKEIQNSLK